ncbi:MAG: hypothetical protein RBU25_19495, partial [Lentisphaeria bacterium]|nr:hypothetical protein [Lentisphaeria bacterium]
MVPASRLFRPSAWFVSLLLLPWLAGAMPEVVEDGLQVTVEGGGYRAVFTRELADVRLFVKDAAGNWLPLTQRALAPDFGLFAAGNPQMLGGARCGWSLARQADAVTVVWHAALGLDAAPAMQVVFICTDDGVLLGGRIANDGPVEGTLWFPPRFTLDPAVWDAYAFVDGAGTRHTGSVGSLDPCPAYAGVSPWGDAGDTTASLDLLAVRATAAGAGFGFVYVDAAEAWAGTGRFLQRHTPANLYLYPGHLARPGDSWRWAWLAPFPAETEAALAARLRAAATRRLADFTPELPPLPAASAIPDFPAELRRPEPLRDINQAVVYTVNETTNSDYALALVRKTGTDLAIRGWFKWNRRPAVEQWTRFPGEAHRLGALFGGGITCSALYDTENGITQEQLLDMATRAPDGSLADAWGNPGVRHGSLSSPAYLDYLFRWCREQIDAGADCLFMDEHTAVLAMHEGYDDHSLRDFRDYLASVHPRTREWRPDDPRWTTELGIALDQPALCPTGRIDSFDYRAYLQTNGWTDRPTHRDNPLASLWGEFRHWRDDRAWKTLTDRIRAHAAEQGRTVLISANGLAPYVDLQVLGVWGNWALDQGHIDLRRNEIQTWRASVVRGHQLAGRRVPVVLFHDWGFGDPPFPWLAAAPSERDIWMRTRGAEIYAAGAFFAFPVLGPFGCDAHRDGTLGTIARQTAFYQTHRDLYTGSRWVGCEGLDLGDRPVSLAAWWHEDTRSLVVHIVNRDVREGVLHPVPGPVELRLPVATLPEQVALVSPDFTGRTPVEARRTENGIALALPGLEAYSVALLRFASQPDLRRLTDPVRLRPARNWARPATADFRVRADGGIEQGEKLEGYLQGRLHTHLRNPPVFTLNAAAAGELRVQVKAVATTGAQLSVRLDDRDATVIDLPDRDGKNDGNAREYDQTF